MVWYKIGNRSRIPCDECGGWDAPLILARYSRLEPTPVCQFNLCLGCIGKAICKCYTPEQIQEMCPESQIALEAVGGDPIAMDIMNDANWYENNEPIT